MGIKKVTSITEILPTMMLYEVHRAHIKNALFINDNDVIKTAHSLGITIKTTYNHLWEIGLFEEEVELK